MLKKIEEHFYGLDHRFGQVGAGSEPAPTGISFFRATYGQNDDQGDFYFRRESHPDDSTSSPGLTSGDRVVVIQSRTNLPVFEYRLDGGKTKTFHSLYDPVSEAKQWAAKIIADSDSIIVVLGIGFFYHVFELLKRVSDNQTIILVEKEVEIFEKASQFIEISHLLNRKNLHVIVGEQPQNAINSISRIQLENSLKNVAIFSHSPSIQSFPQFYDSISAVFSTSKKVNLLDRLKYKKFTQDTPRVLLITTKYFLMGEIISAFQRKGIHHRLIRITQDEVASSEFLEEIIKNIAEFKPDFLFTINHLGFDREGILTQFLENIEMPFASWYVDNPNLIIRQYKQNISPYCAMFLWDRNTLADMRGLGFSHNFYLPLGVDEKRFRPIEIRSNPLSHLASNVSFVGNSMVHKASACLTKSKLNGCFSSLLNGVAVKFKESAERHVEAVLETFYPEVYGEYHRLSDVDLCNYDAAVCWEATRIYRLERVKALLPFYPAIAGDKHWSELIDEKLFRYQPELSYYDELPFFYNATKINFNATSRQMKGAVNQRVFDVLACNRFILTDFQEQMAGLFDIGKEVICYHDKDEIEDLVKYYLRNESERERIALNGYDRVIKDHRYVSRVESIIHEMRTLFG